MASLARRLVLSAVLAALAVPTAAHAQGTTLPAPSAFGLGRIAPGDIFTSFAFATERQMDGAGRGFAVFGGVGGNAFGSLAMRIDCLRVGVDIAVNGTVVRTVFALASGPVTHATDPGMVGQTALFGVIDGDQTTGMSDRDRIDADFNLPSGVNCENAGLAILNPVLRGEIVIRR